MLFKGTAGRSAFDIASDIDSVGGVMNAFTGKELTAFSVKVPDYHLPLAIDLLADIFINSLFNLEDIDKEKSVVLQEISMVEDTPDEYIHDIFEKHFWEGHSLGMPVLGTRDTVDAFDRTEVLQFFEERYRGDNLVIAAVGNMEHEKLVDLVAKLFGTLPALRLKSDETKPQTTARLSCIEKDLEQLHLVVGTPAPATLDPTRFAGILMNSVFGGSMSSRLFQEIRDDPQVRRPSQLSNRLNPSSAREIRHAVVHCPLAIVCLHSQCLPAVSSRPGSRYCPGRPSRYH